MLLRATQRIQNLGFSSFLSRSFTMSATAASTTKIGSGIDPNAKPETLATFGAGCYWGTEKISTAVGFMGGSSTSATYREVCSGSTGHAEVLHLQFDPAVIKYADLVTFLYRIHDPTTKDRQGNDQGTQYRSVIFYHTAEQKKIAEEVTASLKSKFQGEIVTEISPASTFIEANKDHQLYLEANPGGYCNHRIRCVSFPPTISKWKHS